MWSVCRLFYFHRRAPNTLSLRSSGRERQVSSLGFGQTGGCLPKNPYFIGLVSSIVGRFISTGFSMMCSEPFLYFSFRKKSCSEESERVMGIRHFGAEKKPGNRPEETGRGAQKKSPHPFFNPTSVSRYVRSSMPNHIQNGIYLLKTGELFVFSLDLSTKKTYYLSNLSI